MRRAHALALAGLVLLAAGCSGGEQAGETTTVTAVAPAAGASDRRTADTVARVLASVVNVRVRGAGGDGGEGSGVVIGRDGVILTNNHVVAGSAEVTVAFNDGRHRRPLAGEVVGTAPERDLAVIRVAADDLTPIARGRSSTLRLGDSVLALGYPLGLGTTVTQGIVSGLERTITPEGGPQLEGLLQTDAAINPGNSGGALVDARGRLVGINTAGSGLAENVGFAIAIDEALPVAEEILSEPPSERGAWLGVSVDVSPGGGALVAAVYAGSAAADAGIEQGDVIRQVGDTQIDSAEDLTEALSELDPGDSVEVTVIGSEGERTARATLGRRPATLPAP